MFSALMPKDHSFFDLFDHSAIALGTLSGGWRIVKTMGQRICKLRPIDGFCAKSASAFFCLLEPFELE